MLSGQRLHRTKHCPEDTCSSTSYRQPRLLGCRGRTNLAKHFLGASTGSGDQKCHSSGIVSTQQRPCRSPRALIRTSVRPRPLTGDTRSWGLGARGHSQDSSLVLRARPSPVVDSQLASSMECLMSGTRTCGAHRTLSCQGCSSAEPALLSTRAIPIQKCFVAAPCSCLFEPQALRVVDSSQAVTPLGGRRPLAQPSQAPTASRSS